MISVLRCVLRRFYRISAGDVQALRRLSAAYTALGSPSPGLRDRTLARLDGGRS